MKTKSKCKIIFAYINVMSLACIFGVAIEYLSGKGFARTACIISTTICLLSKFTEKLIEALLIDKEEEKCN